VRLPPRSLFGRLSLVLLLGLAAAQGLSVWVQQRERIQDLYRASGLAAGQRIAAVVRLLEAFDPAQRSAVVAAVDAPPLQVTLLDGPVDLDGDPSAHPMLEGHIRASLRRALGAERPLRLAVTEQAAAPPGPRRMGGRFGHGMGPMHGHGPHMHGQGSMQGPAFVAQVRLADGTWVRFDQHLAREALDWPLRLVLSLSILAAGVLAVALLAVRWLTRPLVRLTRAAEGLGRDIHAPPVAERGPLEVQRTARAFNTMQARLRRYLEDRTRILTAVSHDLKTPITRLRLRAEMLDDAAQREAILRDLDEMQAMTRGTLDFLRGLESEERARPVDLAALLEAVVEDARAAGGEASLAGEAAGTLTARPLALKRCLTNLVDNAVRYGGSARLEVTESDEHVMIRVLDAGPGIPAEHLEAVFQPFHRLEGSRSRATGGTGLGLAIARNIARAHGGELSLHNRPEGGLEARLSLPRR
jgi:signal transduction histidine kinase